MSCRSSAAEKMLRQPLSSGKPSRSSLITSCRSPPQNLLTNSSLPQAVTFCSTRPASILSVAVALPLLILGMVATGCDLSGEETPPGLLGSWQVQDLTTDGQSLREQLNARYNRLVITFRSDSGGEQFYSIIGEPESGEPLEVQGTLDIDEGEVTLFPSPSSTIAQPIDFSFQIIGESTLELRSVENGSNEERFLQLIQLQAQGNVDRLVMGLSMGSGS